MPLTFARISSASRSFYRGDPHCAGALHPTPTAWLRPCVSGTRMCLCAGFRPSLWERPGSVCPPPGLYGPVYELGLTCIPLLLISACLLYLCAYCTDAATVLIFQRRLSRGLPGPIPPQAACSACTAASGSPPLLCSLAAVFSLCFSLWASRSNLPLTQWEPDFPLFFSCHGGGPRLGPDETYSERVYPDPLRPNLYDSVTFHFNEGRHHPRPMQAAYRIEQSGSGTRGNAAMMIAYHTELTVHSAQGRLGAWNRPP